MRKIEAQALVGFTDRDYQMNLGVSKEEFAQMLDALEQAYFKEHKRRLRSTKLTMEDKLILTLIYRHEYRSMDTVADNIHWVEQTLLNADLLTSSVTCVYKTN